MLYFYLFEMMNILLAIIITIAVAVLGFGVAGFLTIDYCDCFYVPNFYDKYRLLKKRSEHGRPDLAFKDFDDFIERHCHIKVGSEEYNQLKEKGLFRDQQKKGGGYYGYYYTVWIGYLLTVLVCIIYTIYLILSGIFNLFWA